MASGIAGTFGLLLTLVWTAGFVPTFLEPRRGVGPARQAGPTLAVAARQVLRRLDVRRVPAGPLRRSTWLALGVRTKVWDLTYWWCIPLLLLQFAIFYSFSVLLAVLTRSTVACVFGCALFWLLAWGINYGSVMARGVAGSAIPAGRHACTSPR